MTFNEWTALIFPDLDEDLRPYDSYSLTYGELKDRFKNVDDRITDYDEGSVTTAQVFHDTETGRYWEFYSSSNSWSEEDEDTTVEEVKPVEKTITVYEPI